MNEPEENYDPQKEMDEDKEMIKKGCYGVVVFFVVIAVWFFCTSLTKP